MMAINAASIELRETMRKTASVRLQIAAAPRLNRPGFRGGSNL